MPKLSIITVNLNAAPDLQKTIRSVISQTFTDFEYIIVDGGSGDESKQIIEKYSKHLAHWTSERDSGIYEAMNKGIAKAEGEYLLFLNSGDLLLDEIILSRVFSLNYSQDILYGELIFDCGSGGKKLAQLPECLTSEYLFENTIWHPSAFIKRALFKTTGLYNEKYRITSDYDFFFRTIAIEKVSTRYIPFPITVFKMGGLSSNPENSLEINHERNLIHRSYLSENEIEYFEKFKKLKNRPLSRLLVKRPFLTKIVLDSWPTYLKVRNRLRSILSENAIKSFLKRL